MAHSNGYKSLYAHLSQEFVTDGQSFRQGDLIGRVGNTGIGTGPHLHFEIRTGAGYNGNLDGTPKNFNSSTACGRNNPAESMIDFSFPGLNGSNTGSYEEVKNGGGTHITGPNSVLDVSSQGHTYAWNSQSFGGNPTGYGTRISDAAGTRNAAGYWMVSTSGHIYAYGNARHLGGSPTNFGSEIVAMSKMPNDDGYAMVSDTGNVYAYGSARHLGGSPTGYSGKFVDIEMTPNGDGYWLLTSAGQVYSYGTARHLGNATNFQRAIVAMTRTNDGQGYLLLSKTGQVYAFGNAVWRGNPSGFGGEIADISYRRDGVHGYIVISTAGQHYAYNTPGVGNPSLSGAIF